MKSIESMIRDIKTDDHEKMILNYSLVHTKEQSKALDIDMIKDVVEIVPYDKGVSVLETLKIKYEKQEYEVIQNTIDLSVDPQIRKNNLTLTFSAEIK